MAFIYTALVVANIAALKALTNSTEPKRVDGVFLVVEDNGEGDRAWYQYSASSTTAENLPKIVNPNDGVGRWLQFAGGGDGGGTAPLTFVTGNTGNYNATAGERILVIPEYAVEELTRTIVLPASPVAGDEIEILLKNDTPPFGFFSHTIPINLNGQKLMGTTESTALRVNNNLPADSVGLGGKIAYVNSDVGWYIIPPANKDAFIRNYDV